MLMLGIDLHTVVVDSIPNTDKNVYVSTYMDSWIVNNP